MTDCRFCLKKDTCKRNKANALNCRLYEQDNVAYGKYKEEQELKILKSKERLKNNPLALELVEYAENVFANGSYKKQLADDFYNLTGKDIIEL